MKKLAVYNHGKDSVPWSPKSLALADVAERHGYAVASPDYRGQPDPDERVKQLLALDFSAYDELVLLGSSMGAYVAACAARVLQPRGLFLLAPAFYLPGYRQTEFNPPVENTQVLHGWRDMIVPPMHSWRFCQQYHVRLTMLDADHRFSNEIPVLVQELDKFFSALREPILASER